VQYKWDNRKAVDELLEHGVDLRMPLRSRRPEPSGEIDTRFVHGDARMQVIGMAHRTVRGCDRT
jgi:uncharacterized DUF497 family protein